MLHLAVVPSIVEVCISLYLGTISRIVIDSLAVCNVLPLASVESYYQIR